MLSFIKNIFRRSTIKFGNDIKNFVSVLDSGKKGQKDDLYSGLITNVDFFNRELTIVSTRSYWQKKEVHTIHFDDIVTISRMKDGRLRMWIKEGEE